MFFLLKGLSIYYLIEFLGLFFDLTGLQDPCGYDGNSDVTSRSRSIFSIAISLHALSTMLCTWKNTQTCLHIVKDKIYKQRESLFDLIFKVVKVEAEQVGEPRVVAHDELHLGHISEH